MGLEVKKPPIKSELTTTGLSDSAGYIEIPVYPNIFFVIKWGKTGVIATTANLDVAHGLTKCFQAYVTIASDSPQTSPEIIVVDDTKFTIHNADGGNVTCRWLCVGLK